MTGTAARNEVYVSFFETPVGVGAVVAGSGGLREVFLPFRVATREDMAATVRSRYPRLAGENSLSREAARQLVAYFAGEAVEFTVPLDEEHVTPFRKKVYEIVRGIGRGQVMTYGQVAAAAGSPGAARGVGSAMAANPLPVVIPCHRVVGVGGALTGYSGAGGIDSKRWLLELEASAGAGE